MTKLIAIAGAAFALLALGAAGAVPADEQAVQIADRGFMPDRLEVRVGQKVVWQNITLKDHTVTSRARPAGEAAQDGKDKPLLDSGLIKPGASWTYTFMSEGSYEYACRIDKTMTGTIVVGPAK